MRHRDRLGDREREGHKRRGRGRRGREREKTRDADRQGQTTICFVLFFNRKDQKILTKRNI